MLSDSTIEQPSETKKFDATKYQRPWKTEEEEGEEYERRKKAGEFPDFIGTPDPNEDDMEECLKIVDRINNSNKKKSSDG